MVGEGSSVTEPLRAILPLLKARIVDRGEGHFKIHLGGSTTITVTVDTRRYDIRDGDLLTIYTEVLLKGSSDAQSG